MRSKEDTYSTVGWGRKTAHSFEGCRGSSVLGGVLGFPQSRKVKKRNSDFVKREIFVDTDNEFWGVSGGGGRKWSQKKDVQGPLG